jgi:hypothetical protein
MPLEYKLAKEIFNQINESTLIALKTSLFKAAFNYAHIRAGWEFLSIEEQLENDEERTIAHNRFIDSCNILSRNQMKIGEPTSWIKNLGNDRRFIGDLACWLHAFIAINHR